MLYNSFKVFTVYIIFIFIFNQPALSAQSDLSKLDLLETQFFSQSFTSEPVQYRLNRVEQVIFGRTYPENENKRLERVIAFANDPKQPQKQQANNTASGQSSAADISSVPEDNSATDYPVVTILENSAFQRNFKGENVYLRLNRLESRMFGTTFPQDSLYNRVDKLKSAINPSSSDNYSQASMNSASVFANLSSLELTVFNKTYDREAVINRLSNLESKVFGSPQAGTTEMRLTRLNQNIENSFASNVPNNTYSYTNLGGMNQNSSTQSNTGGTKSAIWDVVKSILFNFLTSGYSNYGSYGSGYYSPTSSSYYGDPYYSYNRSINTNMGAGVHILP